MLMPFLLGNEEPIDLPDTVEATQNNEEGKSTILTDL